MNKELKDPYEIDLNAPRLAWHKQKTWKRHQDTVYWVDIQLAQQKGFKFYQTRSNAIILYDTLPACCIPKVVVMESGEIIYEKVYVSPRLPPKSSCKDNWMKELDSEVAGGSKDSQQIQPKSKTQLLSTERPVKSEQPSGSLSHSAQRLGCVWAHEGPRQNRHLAVLAQGPRAREFFLCLRRCCTIHGMSDGCSLCYVVVHVG